jgi:hypothetical protein
LRRGLGHAPAAGALVLGDVAPLGTQGVKPLVGIHDAKRQQRERPAIQPDPLLAHNHRSSGGELDHQRDGEQQRRQQQQDQASNEDVKCALRCKLAQWPATNGPSDPRCVQEGS